MGLAEASPIIQSYKIVEEFGEMIQAHVKQNTLALKEEIGDVLVTIVVNSLQMNVEDIDYNSTTHLKVSFADGLGSLALMVMHAESYVESAQHDDVDYKLTLRNIRDNYKTSAQGVIELLHQTAAAEGWTLEECLYVAYDKIKDRPAKMVNGTLIKDKDLKEIN